MLPGGLNFLPKRLTPVSFKPTTIVLSSIAGGSPDDRRKKGLGLSSTAVAEFVSALQS